MGVGLLYLASGNRHLVEVMLREIGRPPGPEMEFAENRESYSLAVGLALGMITLGVRSGRGWLYTRGEKWAGLALR